MNELLSEIDGIRPVIWYKLRIRLDDTIYDPAMPSGKFRHFISAAKEFYDIIMPYVTDSVTGGIEVHNKFGDYTYPHVHLHFKSQSKKDTMLKKLKRRYEAMYDEPLTGTKKYSFTPETQVSAHAFFRYPLKQYE